MNAEVLGFFSADEAERLTGIKKGRLAYWHKSGFFAPSFVVDGRRVYSFRDLVGLRTIGILRDERGVSLQHLRGVGDYLRHHSDSPWSSLAVSELGGDVYFRGDGGSFVSASHGEQGVTIELEPIADEIRSQVTEARSKRNKKAPSFSKNRSIMSNKSVIAGTRIRTEAIWNFHEEGFSVEEIIAEYPTLSPEEVAAAIAYERESRESKSA